MKVIERNGKFYPTSMTFQELKTILLAAGIEPRAKVLWKSYDTFIIGLKHLPENQLNLLMECFVCDSMPSSARYEEDDYWFNVSWEELQKHWDHVLTLPWI